MAACNVMKLETIKLCQRILARIELNCNHELLPDSAHGAKLSIRKGNPPVVVGYVSNLFAVCACCFLSLIFRE